MGVPIWKCLALGLKHLHAGSGFQKPQGFQLSGQRSRTSDIARYVVDGRKLAPMNSATYPES
jgi:hypothetical protein